MLSAIVQIGGCSLSCEVATTPSEKALGLQEHPPLDDRHGMLFPFYPAQSVMFHMGRVQFPIDIVFIDGPKVVKITSNLQPNPKYRSRYGAQRATSVLEVRGGFCFDNGISEGTIVTITQTKQASHVEINPFEDPGARERRFENEYPDSHETERYGAGASYDTLRTITEADLGEQGLTDLGIDDRHPEPPGLTATLNDFDRALILLPKLAKSYTQDTFYDMLREASLPGYEEDPIPWQKVAMGMTTIIEAQHTPSLGEVFDPRDEEKATSRVEGQTPPEPPSPPDPPKPPSQVQAVKTTTSPDGSYQNYGATPTNVGDAMKDFWYENKPDKPWKDACVEKTNKGYEVKSSKNSNWSGGTFSNLTEANDRIAWVEHFYRKSEQLLQKEAYYKAAQELVLMLQPGQSLPPGFMKDMEKLNWRMAERQGTQTFLRMLDLYDRRAGNTVLDREWRKHVVALDFYERDAVVHSLVTSGYPNAVGLLRVAGLTGLTSGSTRNGSASYIDSLVKSPREAQSDERPNVTNKRSPGKMDIIPPQDRFQDRQIPADTPGVGIQNDPLGSPSAPEQTIGYDPSQDHSDLLGGDVPAIRPSARLLARVATLKISKDVRKLLEEVGPPNEWSGAVAGILGEETRKELKNYWNDLSSTEQAKVQDAFEKSFETNFELDAEKSGLEGGACKTCDTLGVSKGEKCPDCNGKGWQYTTKNAQSAICIVCFKPISQQECADYMRETGDNECPNLCDRCAAGQAAQEQSEGVNPLTPWSYMMASKRIASTPIWRRMIRLYERRPDLLALHMKEAGGGDVHPGDRVKVSKEGDGLEQDQSGVCEEVQGRAVKVKFDGEPVPRWVSKDMLSVDKSKDDILNDDKGDGGKGGEALGSLLGG
jgi:uncharacterized membrane protein (UPF0127 family)